MKKLTLIATGLAFSMLVATAIAQRGPQRGLRQLPTPDAAAIAALETALTGPSGEYAAYVTYEAVIEKFGPVQPFANILDSEARHIAALVKQMEKYGILVPPMPEAPAVLPETLTAAAELGVQMEIENAAMYETLLADVAGYPDLVRVFNNLEDASLDSHLPALQAAADGTYTTAATCPRASATCPLAGTECPQGLNCQGGKGRTGR